MITGNESDQLLAGFITADVISGGAGDERLEGRAGNDELLGGAGDDALDGGVGNDVLRGGLGDDTLQGSAGDDTYIYALGEGNDLISYMYEVREGKRNQLQLEGIAPDETTLTRSGQNLLVAFTTSDDVITVELVFRNDDPLTSYSPLQMILFEDGTAWDIEEIKRQVESPGIET